MGDLKDPRLLYFKGGLMLVVGSLGAATLLLQNPSLRTLLLLAVTVWGFCRAYYFTFYVIEHYVDPGYRFAGLIDFLRYAMRQRRSGEKAE